MPGLSILLLLAQAGTDVNDAETLRKSARPVGSVSSEVIIVLICALILSVMLFVWAFFIRRRPRTARGALVVERRKSDHGDDSGKRRRRKRRPDHPDNWGRNPTLGETGGLPSNREGELSEDAGFDNSDGGPETARPK